MPNHKHLDQVLVSDSPKLAQALNDFGDFLKTSYFYPLATHEKCEDERAPAAWAKVGKWFEEYIKDFTYFTILRLTPTTTITEITTSPSPYSSPSSSASTYITLDNPSQRAAIIPIKIRSGSQSTDPPQVSWKPLLPGWITYVDQGVQVTCGSGEVDFVLVTT